MRSSCKSPNFAKVSMPSVGEVVEKACSRNQSLKPHPSQEQALQVQRTMQLKEPHKALRRCHPSCRSVGQKREESSSSTYGVPGLETQVGEQADRGHLLQVSLKRGHLLQPHSPDQIWYGATASIP